MAIKIDLNEVADIVRANQAGGISKPAPSKKLFVTSDGQLMTAQQANSVPRDILSEVPQDTFAATRDEVDSAIVRKKFPKDTERLSLGSGITGWLYNITCAAGRPYTMCAYYDGESYQVKVVEPAIETYWRNPHTGHIFADARICFGNDYGAGMPTLEAAYAKSVLWATGFSLAQAGEKNGLKFPFSINQ